MRKARLNITIPASLNDEISNYSKELNQKKSHLIASALDMYFDYLDLKIAEKRAKEDEENISFEDFFKDLGA